MTVCAVCDAAWAEYEKVYDAAWAEYEKVRDAAWAEYEKVRDAHPWAGWHASNPNHVPRHAETQDESPAEIA